jgi:hypothetical protein
METLSKHREILAFTADSFDRFDSAFLTGDVMQFRF